MAYPPGFLDEVRNRLSIADVVGRKVVWDNRKSNPGKGDWWAPCPFHQEKTASFHVEEKKGFYYCFGCHQKGDMFRFVQETENVSFPEAVALLAQEAGVPMPERDPRAQEKADAAAELASVMEEAVKFCRLQLRTARAAQARDYLARRGLDDTAIARFEIGWCPESRTAMVEHLKGKGISPEKIVEAGLAIAPEDGGAPFDRFRARIIFPVRDARGRCIAFGGRSLDPEARAKYLNSPTTPLFDKGRALYNQGPAREAAGKSGRLVVAEGYMDVIALAMHGFEEAVAPLGTAVTEDQLRLMWKMADEPVIALDGDKAGIRAAYRVVDLALPMLAPGKTLRFAILPDGQDPDDLLKSAGRGAMAALLDNAMPLIEMFWRRETEEIALDTPERRAKFDATLRAALNRIEDASVRGHYEAEIRERRRALYRPAPRPQAERRPAKGRTAEPPRRTMTRASLLAQGQQDRRVEAHVRETAILAICIRNPEAARASEAALERLRLVSEDTPALRDAVLASIHAEDCAAEIERILGKSALEKLFSAGHIRSNPYVLYRKPQSDVTMDIASQIARHHAILGREEELAEAAETAHSAQDEALTWRLSQALEAEEAARRATTDAGADTDGEEAERSQYLQRLIDEQSWVKNRR